MNLFRLFSKSKSPATNSSRNRAGKRRTDKRRRLGEQLESRHLLAGDLVFSEIFWEPVAFSDFDDQYFEVRGNAGETIPQGTYMVVVDGDPNQMGEVNSRFDLGGITMGSNGFLAVAQGPIALSIDQNSTSFVGTNDFAGLPTGMYESETTISNRFEHVFGSNTFMLIESAVVPDANTDYDTNDDGILDGDAANWNVLDAITINGTHQGGDPGDAVYGDILFRTEGNQSTAPQGVNTVDVASGGYFARVNGRSGNTATDFVLGQGEVASDSQNMLIASVPGNEAYRHFAGYKLDHLGSENFFTTVVGSKFDDANGNDLRDPDESGLVDRTVFVDVNGNGQLDSYETVLEPDNFPDSTEVMKVVPGVTVTRETDTDQMDSFAPIAVNNSAEATTGDNTFEGSIETLRFDFVEPVSSVTIDASNIGSQFAASAELAVFDANGSLLATVTTPQLVNSADTLTITLGSANISTAKAYFVPEHQSFNLFDNFRFTRPEPSAITDSNGDYNIDSLDYHVGGNITSADLRTVGETETETLIFDRARSLDFTPPTPNLNPTDIVGRTDTNEWWIGRSDGSRFITSPFGSWSSAVTWDDTVTGDFDGDGTADIAGRIGREWWVSLTRNQSLTGGQFWGVWPAASSWAEVQVADVNGDGVSDIIGRNDGGAWWVARSTGSTFVMEQWSHWSINVTWDNILTGDFNGDGRTDLAGRTNGNWFVDLSNGQSFDFQLWGGWSDAVTWVDVLAADFDGDGDDDIAGRTGGRWWIANSTGQQFQNQYWGRWSEAVTWVDVSTGDFNGDGRADIAGRANGSWWIANSNSTFFTMEYWGRWSDAITWEDVIVADFSGDGLDDITGRANGAWWVSRSTGQFFTIEYWGQWSNSINWNDVSADFFTPSTVGGQSVQSGFQQSAFQLSDSDTSSLFVSSPFEKLSVDDALTASSVGTKPVEVELRVRRRSRFE